MNADAFRHFYDYHFTENGRLWDLYVTALSHEQFTQTVRILTFNFCPPTLPLLYYRPDHNHIRQRR